MSVPHIADRSQICKQEMHASFLGLETKYSVADFVHNRARLDDALMTSLVTPYSGNLAVLAAPLEAHEAEDIKPRDVSEILHLLKQRYECIVVDLPHTFDPVTVAALDLADDILLVPDAGHSRHSRLRSVR